MFRNIFLTRLLIVSLVFFTLIAVGTQLYSWHVRSTTEAELERHNQSLQGLENNNETRPAETVDVLTENETPGLVNTLDENAETPMPEDTEAETRDTSEFADIMDAFLPNEIVSEEEASAEEVAVSPFGFGPYPEVPADFPEAIQVPWDWSQDLRHKFQELLPNFELMTRVLIKLWNEGDHGLTGGIIKNGTVYPQYPNTVYIHRTENFEEVTDGFIEGSTFEHYAGPDVSNQTIEMIRNGENPPGIRILDMDTDGINVYNFLNIK